MSAFEDFRKAVLGGVEDLAKNTLKGSVKEARADAEDFVKKSAANIKKWAAQVARGELTEEDFASLVRGERDLAQLNALAQAGIGAVKLRQFRGELVGLVATKAVDILL
jgi:hypothetical protein